MTDPNALVKWGNGLAHDLACAHRRDPVHHDRWGFQGGEAVASKHRVSGVKKRTRPLVTGDRVLKSKAGGTSTATKARAGHFGGEDGVPASGG